MDMFDVRFDPLKYKTYNATTADQNYSLAGFTIDMKRSQTPYFMNVYIPTALLTITSFVGFLVPADIVPGRMALLVIIFLSLVNISSTERSRVPLVR